MEGDAKSLTTFKAIAPALTIDQAKEQLKTYRDLEQALKEDGDFVKFWTKQGKKDCPTKHWRTKIERFFGLSCIIIKDWREIEKDDSVTYFRRASAFKPGTELRHEAEGACNTKEKIRSMDECTYNVKKKMERQRKNWGIDFITKLAEQELKRDIARSPHNSMTHAETRAKNRAVLEFVGFGEVSAEEMPEKEADYTDVIESEERPTASTTPPKVKSVTKKKETEQTLSKTISEAQKRLVFARCQQFGCPEEHLKTYLQSEFGITSRNDIEKGWMDKILGWIQSYETIKSEGSEGEDTENELS